MSVSPLASQRPQGPRIFWARALAPLVLVGAAAALLGCGPSAEAQPSSKNASSPAKATSNGVTIKGEGVGIDATATASLMRGYATQPLSVRILAGWVDSEKAKRASQETDPDKKKKQAMGSFGTLTVQIAAGKAEPGTYQLGPEGNNPQGATFVIGKAKEAGLTDEYTSSSGTLTIKSVSLDAAKVTAIEGQFDGTFANSAGDSRAFTGEFRYSPKKK